MTVLAFLSVLQTRQFEREMSNAMTLLECNAIVNPSSAEFFMKIMETKGFFQFENIINVLVTSS